MPRAHLGRRRHCRNGRAGRRPVARGRREAASRRAPWRRRCALHEFASVDRSCWPALGVSRRSRVDGWPNATARHHPRPMMRVHVTLTARGRAAARLVLAARAGGGGRSPGSITVSGRRWPPWRSGVRQAVTGGRGAPGMPLLRRHQWPTRRRCPAALAADRAVLRRRGPRDRRRGRPGVAAGARAPGWSAVGGGDRRGCSAAVRCRRRRRRSCNAPDDRALALIERCCCHGTAVLGGDRPLCRALARAGGRNHAH